MQPVFWSFAKGKDQLSLHAMGAAGGSEVLSQPSLDLGDPPPPLRHTDLCLARGVSLKGAHLWGLLGRDRWVPN